MSTPTGKDGAVWGVVRARPGSSVAFLSYRFISRILDVAVSVAVLILSSPLMLVLTILIKLDSPGPVLFRHVRVGMRRRRSRDAGDDGTSEDVPGTPFTLYKFRSMYADARERFPDLYAYQYTEEELRTLPIKVLVSRKCAPSDVEGCPDMGLELMDDPRMTRVGRWLRKTSLDELPNFLNVLKGDMCLVGPRPDIAENIRYYARAHLRKLDVKPGITGLAQIKGRGKLPFHQINEYDVEYVDNRSLWVDLRILFKTVRVLVHREGAV